MPPPDAESLSLKQTATVDVDGPVVLGFSSSTTALFSDIHVRPRYIVRANAHTRKEHVALA